MKLIITHQCVGKTFCKLDKHKKFTMVDFDNLITYEIQQLYETNLKLYVDIIENFLCLINRLYDAVDFVCLNYHYILPYLNIFLKEKQNDPELMHFGPIMLKDILIIYRNEENRNWFLNEYIDKKYYDYYFSRLIKHNDFSIFEKCKKYFNTIEIMKQNHLEHILKDMKTNEIVS